MQFDSYKKTKGVLQMQELTAADAQRIRAGRKPYVDFIPSGDLIFEDNNVITDDGDERIAELVGGLSSDAVIAMAIGDGGVSMGDPTIPLAPTKADTALSIEVLRTTPISSVNLITSPGFQIQFSEVFFTNDPGLAPATDYSPTFLGRVINEAGLFTADNVMVARKSYVPLPFGIADRVGVIATWSLHVL